VDHEEANLEIWDSHTLGLFGDDCVCIPGAAESLISFPVKFLCVLKHEDDVRERDMQSNSILLSPNCNIKETVPEHEQFYLFTRTLPKVMSHLV
jgi:hypothetical protein